MRIFIPLLVGVILSSSCGAAPGEGVSQSENGLSASVAKLDAEARKSVGIGLPALAMMFQSGAHSYLLSDALGPTEKSGIEELESAGYIKAAYVETAEGTFIRLIPTTKGEELLSALKIGSRS